MREPFVEPSGDTVNVILIEKIVGCIWSLNKSMKIDVKRIYRVNRFAASDMGLEYTSGVSVSL